MSGFLGRSQQAMDGEQDTSQHLMHFCLQLVHHSQWKSARKIYCGSSVEVPVSPLFDVNSETLDVDCMIYDSYFATAVHRSVSLPETYTGDVIRIYTDDVHVGYVRLVREKDNTELESLALRGLVECEYFGRPTVHGPAVMRNIKRDFKPPKSHLSAYSLSNEAVNKAQIENITVPLFDMVPAVHSPYWPVEAIEWIGRGRPYGLPATSVIKRIVRYGCDFVQVSHNRLRNDNEWRFSFSKAEQCIVKSWAISQRIVYYTLWRLNKTIASSNLCTYYFKTMMFWACEEKSAEFWYKFLLVQSVSELLILMMNWVIAKFCMNYFIPGNNMMDHLIDTDLSSEINALWRILQSRQLISEIMNTSLKNELLSVNVKYKIESLAWIKRAFIIYQRLNHLLDNYTDLFRSDLEIHLRNALFVELSDVYHGLDFLQKSINCDIVSNERQLHLLKSESHLLLAVNLCESREKEMTDDCSSSYIQLVLQNFKSPDTDASRNRRFQLITADTQCAWKKEEQNHKNKRKCLLYSRFVKKLTNKLFNENYLSSRSNIYRNVDIVLHSFKRLIVDGKEGSIHADLYKHAWPGVSPTVNISWFIAKAYLANLYYITQRDVNLTMKTCDELVAVYRQSDLNSEFAERTFPVVLSTQWTGIYDKEIQELLGFYSLCSYVLDSRGRSVYLGVCPVQFAFYLKVRSSIGHSFKGWKINKFIDDFNGHGGYCKYYNNNNCNGRLVLPWAYGHLHTARKGGLL